MKLRQTILALLLAFGQILAYGTVEKGRSLYLAGDYEQAAEVLAGVVKKSPRDGNANYYYGASLAALGRTAEAKAPLEVARGRNVADASRILAEIAFDEYKVDAANRHLDSWAEALHKARKSMPAEYEQLQSRLVMMRNMLERVEKIEVIDSLVVDAEDFFQYYRLSPEAGRLYTPMQIPVADATMIYVPEIAREYFWAAMDSVGASRLMTSAILDDGRIDHPEQLDLGMGDADTNYPFMLTDGQTLYFASNGEGSLGGYDIFMTRRNPEGSFYEAQNMGMPYNSPYDDYMLAIDEATGLGWWATDRNQISGMVTIYVFKPSEMRVNCDSDAPDLVARAKISSIAATQNPQADYSALKAKAEGVAPNRSTSTNAILDEEFAMSIGNGTVYRSFEDFRSGLAADAMEQLLTSRIQIRGLQNRLKNLRSLYAGGKHAVGGEILQLEKRLSDARRRDLQLSNSVVRLEQSEL